MIGCGFLRNPAANSVAAVAIVFGDVEVVVVVRVSVVGAVGVVFCGSCCS